MAHPVAGDVAANIESAKRWYLYFLRNFDVAVVADWIVSCLVLDDNIPEDRRLGQRANATLLAHVDELWLCGDRISSGMQSEIVQARMLGKPVRTFLDLGPYPPARRIEGALIGD